MKIGIMAAMLEEASTLVSYFENVSIQECGGRQFFVGTWHGHEIVLAFSRWGKVAAATTATALITKFEVEKLIFTGLAGATASHLEIGDVVISESLFQHDMDAQPIFPCFEVPLTGITYFKADPALIKCAQAATQTCFERLLKEIPQTVLDSFEIHNPKQLLGVIATGDQFVHDVVHTQAILQAAPEALAVEMEGAAVAQVCIDYQIPFVVIRTISDKANHASIIDFPKFNDEVARHYAEYIVDAMLGSMY